MEAAKKSLEEWVESWKQEHTSIDIAVEKSMIPVILGLKGETARSIQEMFGCRIDIDRKALKVSVRGGSDEKRQKTAEKIQELVEKEKASKAEAAAQRRQQENSSHKPSENVTESKQPERSHSDMPAISDDKSIRSSEFPSKPVGVIGDPKKRNGNATKKVDTEAQEGTEQGRNLFQLLVSEPSI